MIINIDRKGTVQGFEKAIQTTLQNTSVNCLLILSCDANNFTPEVIDPVLKRIEVPIFGGIFPVIIHGKEKMDLGTIIIGLSSRVEIAPINRLSDNTADYITQIDEKISEFDQINTIFVFVDGFSRCISSFISSMFSVFGLECNYIGGGAGSLSMVQKPCLFTNEGLLQDGAVMALLKPSSGIGVSHGWESISGPYRVTEADHNIIRSLDWEPAFEVYRKIILEHSGAQILKEKFFDIAKAYPFGIAKLEAERVVRDPLMLSDDDAIVCVGEVPEGSFVDVLNGDAESLIAAAGRARQLSLESFPKQSNPEIVFFIDCISRVLFLEEKFSLEIDAVWSADQPLVGACTIGEIANSGRDYLEFYNKTSVVAFLEDM